MSASVKRRWRPWLLFLSGLILGAAGMGLAYVEGWAEVSIHMSMTAWVGRMMLNSIAVGVAVGVFLAFVAKMRNQRLAV